MYKMNYSNQNSVIGQQSTNSEEQTFEQEVEEYNQYKCMIEKRKIQINFHQDQQIIYSQNGTILRVVQGNDAFEKPELFNNMDQIHNLSWQGQYGKKQKKTDKWIAFWNNELIENVGGYYYEGQKLGLWKDLFPNYWSKAQIFEIGEFYDDIKIGKWNYIYLDEKMGGGFYNKNGQKQGKWIELDKGFYIEKLVYYKGEYNRNGAKVGSWDIIYKMCKYLPYNQIGYGSYDQEGNEKKIGKWVELFEGFQYCSQVTCNGEYNKNGMKICRWYFMYCAPDKDEYKQIGGGSYDQEGNQIKIGKWIELVEGFYCEKQVYYKGEYNMNGMKVGRWDIMFCKYRETKYQIIAGGSYDLEGNQKKFGQWVELVEEFYCKRLAYYKGEYNLKGMKIGRWDIMYCKPDQDEYKQIGGGSYDQEGNQIKIGKWIELFEWSPKYAQTTNNGEYSMKGQKVGIWVKMDIGNNEKRGETKYND